MNGLETLNGVHFVNTVDKLPARGYWLRMGSKARKQREQAVMRRRILTAARELFVKDGYRNVSMRRIAARIEYSPAALYRYFKNKMELLSELRSEGFALFLARQQESDGIADPYERLRGEGLAYIHFARDHPEYFTLMFTLSTPVDPESALWTERPARSFEHLLDNVRACVDVGWFSGADPQVVAFALWAAVHGLASLLLSGRLSRHIPEERLEMMLTAALEFSCRPARIDPPRNEETLS